MTSLSPLLPTFWTIILLGSFRAVRTLPDTGTVSRQEGRESREGRESEVIERFRTQKTGVLLAYLTCFLQKEHAREALIDLLWPDETLDTGRNNLSIALSSLRKQLEPPGTPPGSVIQTSRTTVRLNREAFTTDIGRVRTALTDAARTKSPAEQETQFREIQRHWGGPLLPAYYEDWVLQERQRLTDDVARLATIVITKLLTREGSDAVSRGVEYARWAVTALEGAQEPLHDILTRLLSAPQASVTAVPVPAPASASVSSEQPLSGGTMTFLLAAGLPSGQDADSIARRHNGAVDSAQETVMAGEIAGEVVFRAVFRRAGDAAACAAELQTQATIPPRMALLTGDAELALPGGAYEGAAALSAFALLAAASDEQALVSETTAALLRRSGESAPPLQDLGLFRLTGEENGERLFEMTAPGRFPRPPRAAPVVPQDRLPIALTRFFGRETEIASLLSLLSAAQETAATDDAGAFLTLTGPGGVGKTRLALEVARRLRASSRALPPTVWYVPFADVENPGDFLQAVWNVVGAGDNSPATAAASLLLGERIVASLTTTSTVAPILLLLDNLEHVAAEASAFVAIVRRRVPGLLILTTSHRPLAIDGEQLFAVEPLPVPPIATASVGPEALVANAATRLFVDRARAVRPDFQITDSNSLAVSELMQRLEGVPLAIELAAARSQVLTPARILAGLDEHGAASLRSRHSDIPARHQSLEAAVEWSFRDLSVEQRAFFLGLSVFTGGWTLAAAQEAAGIPFSDAADHLAVLRDRSLITAREIDTEEMRFGMLETLRAFGAGRLQATGDGEGEIWRLQHARYYLALSARANEELEGGDQTLWLSRLRQEHANLFGALRWAGENDPSLALELASNLGRFWDMAGDWEQGRTALTDALERASGASATVRGIAERWTGVLSYNLGDYDSAWTRFEKALALARTVPGQETTTGRLLNNLGIIACERADYASAAALHEEALAIWWELCDERSTARSLFSLGVVAADQDQYARARSLFTEAMTINRRIGDTRGTATSLNSLGAVANDQGDYEAAQAFFEESLALKRQMGFRRGEPVTLSNLGVVAFRRGDYPASRTMQGEALRLCLELGDRKGAAIGFQAMGAVFERLGKPERAARLLAAAEFQREALGIPLLPAELPDHQRCLSSLRAALGAPAFAAAWQIGRDRTWQETVADALEESFSPTNTAG